MGTLSLLAVTGFFQRSSLMPLVMTSVYDTSFGMMTSSNGNFSALLALCAGDSPVTGEFPAQRPVTRSFDVFFDLRPNKPMDKQSWGWWFETPPCSPWRHRNGVRIWNDRNHKRYILVRKPRNLLLSPVVTHTLNLREWWLSLIKLSNMVMKWTVEFCVLVAINHCNESHETCTCFTLLCALLWFATCRFTHVLRGYFTGTGAMLRLPHSRRSNFEESGKISQMNTIGFHDIPTKNETIFT